jgi:pyroglutamyl-peptidase
VTVLLTAFEPFDGQEVNASWLAVESVAAAWSGPPLEVVCLPVSFARAPVALLAALQRVRPDVVVCVGEAGEREAVSIERVAINVADARIPDNDGARPVDEPLVPDGPAAYLSRLPLREGVAAVTRSGVPAEVSNSAGTFVCNTVFYELARALAGTGVPHGFVHVPRTPAQTPDRPDGGMSTAMAARGLAALVQSCLPG